MRSLMPSTSVLSESRSRKIVLLGLSNVGKTSIGKFLKTFRADIAADTTPSVKIEKISKRTLYGTLHFLIQPGQKRLFFNPEQLGYILENAYVIMYVIDSADRSRLSAMIKAFVWIIKQIRTLNLHPLPMLYLVAHKQDKKGAMHLEEVKKFFVKPFLTLLRGFKVRIFETSIYMPSSIIRLIKSLYTEDKSKQTIFDVLVRKLAIKTNSTLTVLCDGEGLLLSYSYTQNKMFNQDDVLNIAAFSTNFYLTYVKERRLNSNLKILPTLTDHPYVIFSSFNSSQDNTILITFIPMEDEYTLILTMVLPQFLLGSLFTILPSHIDAIRKAYLRRYK